MKENVQQTQFLKETDNRLKPHASWTALQVLHLSKFAWMQQSTDKK